LRARIAAANTAAEAFGHAQTDGIGLGDAVAEAACRVAAQVVEGTGIAVDTVVFDRDGNLVGRAPR
jgi:cobalt-precorrin-5B (C1)-methyltransferase